MFTKHTTVYIYTSSGTLMSQATVSNTKYSLLDAAADKSKLYVATQDQAIIVLVS